MKSKDFLRSKGILSNDSHHFIIDFHDGREINLAELLEEYAQQSQPSGMSAEEVKEIAENHFKNTTWLEGTQEQDTKFGFRIGYMKAMKDFAIQNPSTASPAGAAEGVKRYETVVNDTGFDKSSEHYVNNVFMRNANVWSDEYDWMMTKDRFVDVVSLFFTTTQPASEGMAEALRLLDTASNLVGNPGTNISSSTDLACDSWQEKYKKFLASISPGVEDNQTKKAMKTEKTTTEIPNSTNTVLTAVCQVIV